MGEAGEYLSARQAAAMLEVKLPTLYAYTSRGLVRSVPGERGRERRYLRSDLERLRARRDARSGHGPVAAAAMRFGEPVLDSAITAISPERGPIYRGQTAAELAAADVPFEHVAELLWTGALPAADGDGADRIRYLWGSPALGLPREALPAIVPGALHPLPVLSIVVPLLASRDPGRFAERVEAVAPRARTLIRRMAAALSLSGRASDGLARADSRRLEASLRADSVAAAVAAAFGASCGAAGVRALNRALVLIADHELNASAFAARVAASTGADMYACVEAALAALSGPRHGGASSRIEALLSEVGRAEDAERVVHERAGRGEGVEGFGHPLYPGGDPRAPALLQLAAELAPESPAVQTCLALVEALERGEGGRPTIDMGLVALAAALDLGPGAAVGLFAVGRCAGWIAHALEHYEAGYLLRPRARYLQRDYLPRD